MFSDTFNPFSNGSLTADTGLDTYVFGGADCLPPRRRVANQEHCSPSITLQCGRRELAGESHRNPQPHSVFLQQKHPLRCPRHWATLQEKTPPLPTPQASQCPAAEPLGHVSLGGCCHHFCLRLLAFAGCEIILG